MKLIYVANTSLDGYVEDDTGGFEWAEPDEEVFASINDLMRPIGTNLHGRRMYETMVYWEDADTRYELSAVERDFAELWRASEKVVYSRSLTTPSSARTRVERNFDPVAVERMKATATRDLTVSGAQLAAQAIRANLVDECHLFVRPVVVGGGKPSLPDGVRWDLELVDERRFARGVVHLHYRTKA